MANELSSRASVRVLGPHGAARQAPVGVDVLEVPLSPLWRFLICAQWRALREAWRWKPDIVLAGSGLTAPLAWLASRICGARAVAYVHGLDISVRHPVYSAVWLPFLRRMDRLIANSNATKALAAEAGCNSSRIGIVHPGVDVSGQRDRESSIDFRLLHGLGSRSLMLSVGRLTRRKGLQEFVAKALPRIVAARPEAMLLVVGDSPGDALHAVEQSRGSIEAAASAAGVGANIRFVGRLSEAELTAAYVAADVHVFPVRRIEGDPEGFGMVAIEAAAHGLPTVAFATGGVVDAVAEGQSGWLIVEEDYDAFGEAVTWALSNRGAMRAACQRFAAGFSWHEFGSHVEDQLCCSLQDSIPR